MLAGRSFKFIFGLNLKGKITYFYKGMLMDISRLHLMLNAHCTVANSADLMMSYLKDDAECKRLNTCIGHIKQ